MNIRRHVAIALIAAIGCGLPYGTFSDTKETEKAAKGQVVKCRSACQQGRIRIPTGMILLFVPKHSGQRPFQELPRFSWLTGSAGQQADSSLLAMGCATPARCASEQTPATRACRLSLS